MATLTRHHELSDSLGLRYRLTFLKSPPRLLLPSRAPHSVLIEAPAKWLEDAWEGEADQTGNKALQGDDEASAGTGQLAINPGTHIMIGPKNGGRSMSEVQLIGESADSPQDYEKPAGK